VPNSTKWNVVGCWTWLSPTTLRITELPVGTWTNNYKEFLEKGLDGYSSFKKDDIKEVKSNYTDTTVHFTVKLSGTAAAKYQADNELLAKHFKLSTTIDTGNMHAFDADGKMKKYATVQDILNDFVHERRQMYVTRKRWQVSELVNKLQKLHNKIRFLTMVTRQEISFQGKTKATLLSELESCGFPSESHEYLLGMSLWSMTADKIAALQHEHQTQTETLRSLRGTSPEQIWLQDLGAIESEFCVKRSISSSVGPRHKRQKK
jgi:DNA topoisomerase-2